MHDDSAPSVCQGFTVTAPDKRANDNGKSSRGDEVDSVVAIM
jgi:hypothetical protein